jgi:hypothetical protein
MITGVFGNLIGLNSVKLGDLIFVIILLGEKEQMGTNIVKKVY